MVLSEIVILPAQSESAWVPLFPRGVNNSSREVWVKNRKPRCQFATSLSFPFFFSYFCIFLKKWSKQISRRVSSPLLPPNTLSHSAPHESRRVFTLPGERRTSWSRSSVGCLLSFCSTILLKQRRVRGAAEHNAAQTFVSERVIEYKTINNASYKLPLNPVKASRGGADRGRYLQTLILFSFCYLLLSPLLERFMRPRGAAVFPHSAADCCCRCQTAVTLFTLEHQVQGSALICPRWDENS